VYRFRTGLGSLTTDLAGAIQRMEGACSGSTCTNNNPGNLRAGPGATGVDSRGIAIFPDMATGEAALQHQVDLNIGRGLTLDEFFGGKAGVYAGYAPAADSNNPSAYASTVAGWLGIPENSVLASLPPGSGSIPLDTGATSDPLALVDTSGSGLSTGALVALALATGVVVWAAAS
jgi:hypothetical protein